MNNKQNFIDKIKQKWLEKHTLRIPEGKRKIFKTIEELEANKGFEYETERIRKKG